ncbi:hypothetical protein KAH37_08460 [bacterium]|nr:hypothetical protein [bacterium]
MNSSYFVFFNFELTDGELSPEFEKKMEDVGLKSMIDSGGEILHLPQFSYMGEYTYNNPEDLKNALYTEIKELFAESEITALIFMSVSEFATIGIDQF